MSVRKLVAFNSPGEKAVLFDLVAQRLAKGLSVIVGFLKDVPLGVCVDALGDRELVARRVATREEFLAAAPGTAEPDERVEEVPFYMQLALQPRRFRNGDLVSLKHENDQIRGLVLLASGNGLSLAVSFDGMFIGYAGCIPLVSEEAGAYIELVGGRAVAVEFL